MNSSGSSDSLADALSNMADGQHKPERDDPPQAQADPADVPEGEPVDDAGFDFDDEAPAVQAAGTSDPGELTSGGSTSGGRTLASRRPKPPSGMAKFGVKASMVIGMLLLIPAIWAVLVLVGVDVFNANAAGAKQMALLMLVCWPIGGALIGGAVHFNKQLVRQQEACDQAIARERADAS